MNIKIKFYSLIIFLPFSTYQNVYAEKKEVFQEKSQDNTIYQIATEEAPPIISHFVDKKLKEPYTLKIENNQYLSGADVEIINKIFNTAHLKYNIKVLPKYQIINMLEDGQIDMALNIYKTQKLDNLVYYSKKSIRTQNYVFFGRRQATEQKETMTLEEASNGKYKVGINVGYLYPSIIWKYFPYEKLILNKNLIDIKGAESCVNFLINGRIDLFIGNKDRINSIIDKLGYSKRIIQYRNLLYWKDLFYAFSKRTKTKNFQSVYQKIDRIIYKMWESGELEEINKKWIKFKS